MMIDVQPFFILANPRSGSSLLRIICESHSNITVPPESGFMEWWHDKYNDWNIKDSNNLKKVEWFCKDLLSSKKMETYDFNIEFYKTLIKERQPVNYSELIALIYISYGINQGKKLLCWGDKNNYYLHKTDLINRLYPKAKYIHLVRDGRDVATSYLALKKINSSSEYAPKLSVKVEEIAREWDINNQLILSFFENIPKGRVLQIRYEDIVINLKKECVEIASFLNVPFDKRMLEYYLINKLQSLEPKETLDWKKKTLQKPDITNIGKYKKELTKKEIDLFNAIAKKSLIAFDYE